ncbi:hypothetical protein KY284_032886 [Solanum tuberosum]|nr:hypothetical protein KY284_032886 [Solanum tuberosum]
MNIGAGNYTSQMVSSMENFEALESFVNQSHYITCATMYTCVCNWEQQVFGAAVEDLEINYSSRRGVGRPHLEGGLEARQYLEAGVGGVGIEAQRCLEAGLGSWWQHSENHATYEQQGAHEFFISMLDMIHDKEGKASLAIKRTSSGTAA